MYSVDHLVEQHLKQMEKLERQQEKAARKRERQQQRLEHAFAKFHKECLDALTRELHPAPEAGTATSPAPAKAGFMRTLRAFLF